MPPKKRLSSLRCLHGPCNTYFVSTPIGTMQILSCANGLHSVGQVEDPDFQPDPHCISWFEAYFKYPKSLADFSLPPFCQCICSPKGLFLETVWLTLASKVPFGTTTSYGSLAKLAGRPGAAIAVGSAMRKNPFQILVPCHRVIKSNGQNGNYCGGTKNQLKNWLLDHERNSLSTELTSRSVTTVC
ncbi:methylated-DNA--protein-cysteine methyltransferase [Galendromus occidentalis]|uniref:Methylated-DNA--protein-cysteine methyltransferase n=1 Tax=Galendromus occidentalis TaxID=34638 RepID=A0AAJ7L499_9ACAR|nr:methylated-DNA--protein-cysteine methyltransferase [Galendromus occidentalis]